MPYLMACDECGSTNNVQVFLSGTGRVLIDGVDNNQQACMLCADHYPDLNDRIHKPAWEWQPPNCVHVSFYYSKPENWDEPGWVLERYAPTKRRPAGMWRLVRKTDKRGGRWYTVFEGTNGQVHMEYYRQLGQTGA